MVGEDLEAVRPRERRPVRGVEPVPLVQAHDTRALAHDEAAVDGHPAGPAAPRSVSVNRRKPSGCGVCCGIGGPSLEDERREHVELASVADRAGQRLDAEDRGDCTADPRGGATGVIELRSSAARDDRALHDGTQDRAGSQRPRRGPWLGERGIGAG